MLTALSVMMVLVLLGAVLYVARSRFRISRADRERLHFVPLLSLDVKEELGKLGTDSDDDVMRVAIARDHARLANRPISMAGAAALSLIPWCLCWRWQGMTGSALRLLLFSWRRVNGFQPRP